MKEKKESAIKRHIDCDWLMKVREGVYVCHDSRNPKCGEEMDIKEVNKECCEFFHRNKDK